MSLWAKVGFYSSLALVIPAGAVGGYGLGWLLDRWLHTSPLFALILCLVGAGAGVVDIVQILTRTEKRQDSVEPHDGSGSD